MQVARISALLWDRLRVWPTCVQLGPISSVVTLHPTSRVGLGPALAVPLNFCRRPYSFAHRSRAAYELLLNFSKKIDEICGGVSRTCFHKSKNASLIRTCCACRCICISIVAEVSRCRGKRCTPRKSRVRFLRTLSLSSSENCTMPAVCEDLILLVQRQAVCTERIDDRQIIRYAHHCD